MQLELFTQRAAPKPDFETLGQLFHKTNFFGWNDQLKFLANGYCLHLHRPVKRLIEYGGLRVAA